LRAVLAALFVYELFGHTVIEDIVSALMALGSADAIICHAADDDSSGPSQHPGAGHDHCVVCTVAAAAPPIPATIVLAAVFGVSQDLSFVRPTTSAPIAREHDPRTSQGPPQAA
jgi:hypothetical protein